MKGSTVAIIVLSSLLALGGYFVWKEYEAKTALRASVQGLEDIAETATLRARGDSLIAAHAHTRADSVVALLDVAKIRGDSLAKALEADVEEATETATVAGKSLEIVFDTIKVYLPIPQKILVDSARVRVALIDNARVIAVKAFEAQAKDRALFEIQVDSAGAALERRAVAADSATTSARGERDAERDLKETWMKVATPGTLQRMRHAIPFLSIESTITTLIVAGGLLLLVP